jgi:hypothetical protein
LARWQSSRGRRNPGCGQEVWPVVLYFRSKFLATNNALAGRSARRRMK